MPIVTEKSAAGGGGGAGAKNDMNLSFLYLFRVFVTLQFFAMCLLCLQLLIQFMSMFCCSS